MDSDQVPLRVAGPGDVPAVVATLTEAFFADPLWAWAFADPQRRHEQYTRWWRLYVDGAMRYGTVFLTPGAGSVAVWIPPGGAELAPAQADALPAVIAELAGEYADRVGAACDALDAHHPDSADFWYLTLLATRCDQRGTGLGMALLRRCLADIDILGRPAYLESSNPANNARYGRCGFQARATFTIGAAGPEVTTMWRPAGG